MTGFVALHGGVGEELSDGFIAGLHRAADAAATTLAPAARPPGAVLDAVVAAVTVLEADPEYNAGYGAVLNERGDIEVDASLVDGGSGRWAGVALLPGVRHPIRVARELLDSGRTVLLAAAGAAEFAADRGHPTVDLRTAGKVDQWRAARQGGEVDTRHDTVGCIAVTDDLRIAAGASSGGRTGKPAGRIGDAAIGGAGAYADANCAVVCTGTGEIALRTAMAQRAAHECRRRNPGAAAHWAITTAAEQGGEMGVIVYDQLSGNVAVAHNTAYFAVLLRNGSDQPLLTPRTGDVLVRPAPGGSPVQSPARLAQPWV